MNARRGSFSHAIRKPLSLCFAARDPKRPARVLAVRSDHAQSVGRSWSYWPLSPSLSHEGGQTSIGELEFICLGDRNQRHTPQRAAQDPELLRCKARSTAATPSVLSLDLSLGPKFSKKF